VRCVADFTNPTDPNALTWPDFERDLMALGLSPALSSPTGRPPSGSRAIPKALPFLF